MQQAPVRCSEVIAMRALVVFESMFGNTEVVARAIASGLEESLEVAILEAGAAPDTADGFGLLVVGAPTHAFGLSRDSTRQDARRRAGGAIVSQGIGIREWLDGLQAPGRPVQVATFDTRIDRPRVPGSAARRAEKRLRRLGFIPLVDAESFWVSDVSGPLLDGETDRALQWGRDLAARLLGLPLTAGAR
jgi:hypothetical protein